MLSHFTQDRDRGAGRQFRASNSCRCLSSVFSSILRSPAADSERDIRGTVLRGFSRGRIQHFTPRQIDCLAERLCAQYKPDTTSRTPLPETNHHAMIKQSVALVHREHLLPGSRSGIRDWISSHSGCSFCITQAISLW